MDKTEHEGAADAETSGIGAAAAASLLLWPLVLLCGRMIGYS
jgi:hypothetical protein